MTTVAIALGVITYASGIKTFSGNVLAGEVILLSALACRSANKRRLMEVQSSNKRFIYEFLLMAIMVLLVTLQIGLKDLITSDPVPNFIIPVICFMFYSLAFYRARKIGKAEEIMDEI